MLAITAMSAFAAPIYMSFEGTVDNSNAPGIAVGQTVHYVLAVDHATDGYYVYNGNVYPEADYWYFSDYVDFFSSELVGGDIITADTPGAPYSYAWHYGYSYPLAGTKNSFISGSNSDPSGIDVLSISSSNSLIEEWAVGQIFQGVNYTYSNSRTIEATSILALVDISDVNPLAVTLPGSAPEAVPETSTLALFGVGVLGLGFSQVRRARKPRKV